MTGILIIGQGGREHALAWKLAQSPLVDRVRIAPGNGGPFGSIDLNIDDPEAILGYCALEDLEMVVIGPEIPLAKGLVDQLQDKIQVFGPTREAAMLETSKAFAKKFMREIDLPTALYAEFTDIEEANKFIDGCNWDGIVVKADGLAAGKGVIVSTSKEEAKEAVKHMLEGEFGESGSKIILEERLDGYEVSALCFADGSTISRMPLIRDHKRLLENDAGPNTGGMGVIGPVSVPKIVDEQISEYLISTIRGLQKQRIFYKGVLYAGLMITAKGPYILEYNCRFGDPETEILMRLLDSDLYQIIHACIHSTLDLITLNWKREFACGIVLCSRDYPYKGDKGTPIENMPADSEDTVVFHAGTMMREDHVLTNGGRILCVTSLGKTMEEARKRALITADLIEFEGKSYRRDIGIIKQNGNPHYLSLTYGDSGVDIDEGNRFVENIKGFVQETLKSGTSQIGGFGAIIDLKKSEYDQTTQIVAGIDGVGTKIEVADRMGDYSGIGYDVVGMCVNDILCHCAAPIAFLDYFVCGKLERKRAIQVVKSISEACIQADCSLVGGETAEMPGVYSPNQWDLAGCAIGVRHPDWPQLPQSSKIEAGDVILGLRSNGLHSNGFSLVRRIFKAHKIDYKSTVPWGDTSFGKVLLSPTRIYIRSVLLLMRGGLIKAAAHITGGGITENSIRVLDKESELALEIDASSWPKQELFNWLSAMGPVETKEMLKTFNCGIGMTLIVSKDNLNHVKEALESSDEEVYEIGRVVERTDDLISYTNLETAFDSSKYLIERKRVKVGILISGAGTNMERLIERSQQAGSNSQVVVVISNDPKAGGLGIAQRLQISTAIVPHTRVREEGDMKISQILHLHQVELICLAGYMRILSGKFVKEWENRIINIHPALLPSFRGGHAVRDTLAAGVKVTGCTAHLVVEEVDAGAIIAQEVVYVDEDDTEESLHQKIKEKEHSLFPEAMELMAIQIIDAKNSETNRH